MTKPDSSNGASASNASNDATVTTEQEPTLLEQMGGLSGLVSATLPVVVLIPVNNVWGLGPALLAALGVALLIAVWRIARKETLQPAISGLVGVGICAAIAWFTGDAKGYFLYGIWMSLLFFIVAAISIVVRWPLVGVIWKGINGEDMRWRTVAPARRAYAIATAALGSDLPGAFHRAKRHLQRRQHHRARRRAHPDGLASYGPGYLVDHLDGPPCQRRCRGSNC